MQFHEGITRYMYLLYSDVLHQNAAVWSNTQCSGTWDAGNSTHRNPWSHQSALSSKPLIPTRNKRTAGLFYKEQFSTASNACCGICLSRQSSYTSCTIEQIKCGWMLIRNITLHGHFKFDQQSGRKCLNTLSKMSRVNIIFIASYGLWLSVIAFQTSAGLTAWYLLISPPKWWLHE